VNSALSGIAIPRRRRLAATLSLFASLFVAVGAVAATGGGMPSTVRVFSALALVVAAVLGLISWGVLHSVKVDLAENQLDAAIEDAIAASNGGPPADEGVAGGGGKDIACSCGHDHDPDELHVTDTCARNGGPPANEGVAGGGGGGEDCSHNCDTCVLAAMRPSPTTPRTQRLSH
jgi:hypothetical protein